MKYDSEIFEKLELIWADFKVLFVNDIFSFESWDFFSSILKMILKWMFCCLELNCIL